MASVTVLPLRNYQAGTEQFGFPNGTAIGDTVQSVDFSVRRCTTADPTIWPDQSVILTIALEISIDGGEWFGMGGFSAAGGIVIGRDGNEATISRGGGGLPTGVNRRMRGTVTISGGTLRSSATIEVN